MQTLCKSFLMSEEFEDPHGHYTLEKGLLHVKSLPRKVKVGFRVAMASQSF